MASLNFQPSGLFSTGRRRIQKRPGGRLQRLAVRQDFPVGKVGGEILAHFHGQIHSASKQVQSRKVSKSVSRMENSLRRFSFFPVSRALRISVMVGI
jgi:hypothetical protein